MSNPVVFIILTIIFRAILKAKIVRKLELIISDCLLMVVIFIIVTTLGSADYFLTKGLYSVYFFCEIFRILQFFLINKDINKRNIIIRILYAATIGYIALGVSFTNISEDAFENISNEEITRTINNGWFFDHHFDITIKGDSVLIVPKRQNLFPFNYTDDNYHYLVVNDTIFYSRNGKHWKQKLIKTKE